MGLHMSDHDELLFGTAREPARDIDGDGVRDGQEAVDGTDPNDANSSVRLDLPSLDPALDPRGDLRQVMLERETTSDVTGMGPGEPTDGPGGPGPGSTIAAGDDDDLEELEVERYVAPDADQLGHPEDFPPGAGTVGIIIPDYDQPSGDDIVPVSLDAVADAMPSHLDMDQHEVPQTDFGVPEFDHAMALPDAIDLDDGF